MILADEKASRERKMNFETFQDDYINIAVIQFVFDNARLINLLKERGSAIKALNFPKVKQIEESINTLKKDEYDTFTRPISAFITFERREGIERALKYKPANQRKSREPRGTYLEEPVVMTAATEPTNIIWENRQFTRKERAKQTLISVTFIILLLLISFTIITVFKLKAMRVQQEYP